MKVCTYNEFEYCKVLGYYLNVCEFESCMNMNPIWIWFIYKFEFEIFKYSCNLYLLNGIGWLKLADTRDSLPHLEQRIFGVGCVMTANTKDRSLMSVDISRHKKWVIFVLHKGYQIQWPTPKTGYQPTLPIVFVVVQSKHHGSGTHLLILHDWSGTFSSCIMRARMKTSSW
jgi:hypothetical protein